MTVSVAKDNKTLKKRLLRFFDEASESRKYLTKFLNEFSLASPAYVFGGVVRDIALFGVKPFRSDVDIVFTEHSNEVERFLADYNATKNKFGGYRLDVGDWQVDIWQADKSWAFRQGYRKYNDINSMLETTITNWDAVLFDWNEKALICKSDYIDNLKSRYLDIVLNDNPNSIGVLVRLLRTCASKEVHQISYNVSSLLMDGLRKHTYEDISSYELESYDDAFINSHLINYFKENKDVSDADLLPVNIQPFNMTNELFS